MKNILFFIGLMGAFSCGKNTTLSKFPSENDENNRLIGNESILVHLSETQKLETIQDLNRKSETLTLSDKIVLTSSELFLKNKDKNNNVKLLKAEDVTGNPADIKLRLSFFCSDSKTDLQIEENFQKYSEDLVVVSHPRYLNIIDLVPRELISKNVNDSVYCTFIFKIKGKSYSLIQQKIKKTFFNESGGVYGVSLLKMTESGLNLVESDSVLTQKELQNISFSNDTQKEVENYELFCEGSRILSVSYSQPSSIFLKVQNFKVKKEDKKGIKNCIFFARGAQTVQGISPFFKVDFNSFVSEFHSENKEQKVISALTGNTSISVYLNETQKLETIQDLNRKSETLTLSDKIVLTSSEFFLENLKNKDNNVKLLKAEDVTGNPADIKLRLSFFCSDSEKDLQIEENFQKYSEDLVVVSHPLYLNIIDLVPRELISKNVNDSVYCTFIFKIKGKSYSLIQQKIKKTFFNESGGVYGVSLLKMTESGLNLVESDSVLTQKELQNISFSNDTQKEVENYELFCEGSRILSVSYNQPSSIFLKVQNFKVKKEDQKGIKNCIFFARGAQTVQGISPFFKVDFNSFVIIDKASINLSDITSPRIQKRRMWQSSYIEFKDLNKSSDSQDYSNVDVLVKTQCVDSSDFSNTVFSKETRIPLMKRIPIISVLPEELFFLMSLNYDNYLYNYHFSLYQHRKKLKEIKKSLKIHKEAQHLHDLHNKRRRISENLISRYKEDDSYQRQARSHKFNNISERLWWLSLNFSKELFERELDEDHYHDKKDLEDEISEMHCLYQIKLEEKNNPLNQKLFSDIYKNIGLNKKYIRLGYKLDYISETKGDTIFFNHSKKDIKKQQIQVFEENKDSVKVPMSQPYLIKLKDIVSGRASLGFLKSHSLANESLDRIVLRCYAEPMESRDIDQRMDFEDYKPIELEHIQFLKNGGDISLKVLLGTQDMENKLDKIKGVSKKDHLFICRVLLYSDYSENEWLKYLSPEFRFIH